MNAITQMSESEMVATVEMLVNLARDGYKVTISTETDRIGLDSAFRATVEDEEEVQVATSGGNARLLGVLSDVFEMTPDKDDACKHPSGIIRGMEG